MENYGMDAVPLYLQWQEGGGVGEADQAGDVGEAAGV